MEKAEEDSVDIDEEEMSKWLNTSADEVRIIRYIHMPWFPVLLL